MRQSPNRRPDSGFTILELLIVTMILPVIAFTIFANFRSGYALWSVVTQPVPGEELARFSRRLSDDTQSAGRYSAAPFAGTPVELSFFRIPASDPVEPAGAVLRVRYVWDDNANAIVREERDLSEQHRDRPGRVSLALAGVEECRFEYLVFDKLNESYQWRDAWSGKPEEFPAALRVNFTVMIDGVRRPVTRTFRFYLGS